MYFRIKSNISRRGAAVFYILLTVICVVIIEWILHMNSFQSQYIRLFCLNDIYCELLQYGHVYILLVVELRCVVELKEDMRISVVVRMRSMHHLWNSLSCKMFAIGLQSAIFITATATVYALVRHVGIRSNWDKTYSYMYGSLGRAALQNVPVVLVAVVFVMTVCLVSYTLSMALALIWWWSSRPVYGYVLPPILEILDKYAQPSMHCYQYFSCALMNSKRLAMQTRSIWQYVGYLAGSTVVMYFIGVFAFRRKDYLKEWGT